MPTARAVEIRGAGGVDVLAIREIEIRDPGPGEVLVEVAAAGLNRADILQRRGLYPAPAGAPANIAGLEYAGTVAAVGSGVPGDSDAGVQVGARVMGIVGGGGMATHVVVHHRELIPVPAAMSLEHAAAIPEVFLTAYDGLVAQAGLEMGHEVLLHAVGSGIGTAAVQLVNAAGGRAIGTSRTRSKLERCAELGLVHGILVKDGRFAREVRELTGGRGADIVLDAVGGPYIAETLAGLATRGVIIVIGLLGGITSTTPLGALLSKRASVVGSVLRARPLEEKAALAQRFARRVIPLFESGALRPIVGDVMAMTDIAAAHERMEQNDTFGKIILAW